MTGLPLSLLLQVWRKRPTHDELSRREGGQVLKVFKDRLAFNAGQRAPGLLRTSVQHNRPRRPPGGFNLTVTEIVPTKGGRKGGALPPMPSGAAPPATQRHPRPGQRAKFVLQRSFVSRPDGRRRALREKEAERLRRKHTERPLFAHRRVLL